MALLACSQPKGPDFMSDYLSQMLNFDHSLNAICTCLIFKENEKTKQKNKHCHRQRFNKYEKNKVNKSSDHLWIRQTVWQDGPESAQLNLVGSASLLSQHLFEFLEIKAAGATSNQQAHQWEHLLKIKEKLAQRQRGKVGC